MKRFDGWLSGNTLEIKYYFLSLRNVKTYIKCLIGGNVEVPPQPDRIGYEECRTVFSAGRMEKTA